MHAVVPTCHVQYLLQGPSFNWIAIQLWCCDTEFIFISKSGRRDLFYDKNGTVLQRLCFSFYIDLSGLDYEIFSFTNSNLNN